MDLETVKVAPSAAMADSLRADLLDTWVAATNAGGSVGFTAPADADAIAATLDKALARVAAGTDALVVLRAGERAVGLGLLVDRGSELSRHWRTVLRVMVHPDLQGRGGGARLMRGLREAAEDLGLDHLQLTVRSGEGLEEFYARFGYRVVGRHPRAIRVGPGAYRDEVMMVASLAR